MAEGTIGSGFKDQQIKIPKNGNTIPTEAGCLFQFEGSKPQLVFLQANESDMYLETEIMLDQESENINIQENKPD